MYGQYRKTAVYKTTKNRCIKHRGFTQKFFPWVKRKVNFIFKNENINPLTGGGTYVSHFCFTIILLSSMSTSEMNLKNGSMKNSLLAYGQWPSLNLDANDGRPQNELNRTLLTQLRLISNSIASC